MTARAIVGMCLIAASEALRARWKRPHLLDQSGVTSVPIVHRRLRSDKLVNESPDRSGFGLMCGDESKPDCGEESYRCRARSAGKPVPALAIQPTRSRGGPR